MRSFGLFTLAMVWSIAWARDFSELGFARVRAVSPPLVLIRPLENAKIVTNEMDKAARDHVPLLTFSELNLTGYTAEDHLFRDDVQQQVIQGLQAILLKSVEYRDLITIVGAPWRMPNGRYYNTAVVIRDGKILGVVPKQYLPNYGEFYERRWFSSGIGMNVTYSHPDLGEIHFAPEQIFSIGPMNIAIEICEDAWANIPPSHFHTLAGANVIVNLSASNALVGKLDYRRNLIKMLSSQQMGAYIYASSGPWESSRDLVFDGHVMIAENGSVLGEGRRFSFEGTSVTVDLDIQRVMNERQRNKTFGEHTRVDLNGYRHLQLSPRLLGLPNLLRQVSATPLFVDDPREMRERGNEIFDIQVTGLIRRLSTLRHQKIVIGVSGGSDSTLALLVAKEALRRMGKPASDIIAVTMPGFGTSDRTKDQADRLIAAIGATRKEISIRTSVEVHFRDIGHDGSVHDLTYENAQARERTQILFDLATKEGGIVLGTGDLSELCLGWCTYNADQTSHYNVNASIPKTLVKFLIRNRMMQERNRDLKRVLQDILDTPISPELLPLGANGEIVQKSEDAFGPYEVVDFVLFYLLRYGMSAEKIQALMELAFANRYEPTQLAEWRAEILKRFDVQRFKTTSQPGGPLVGSMGMSPRYTRFPDDLANCERVLSLVSAMQSVGRTNGRR